MRYYRGVVPCLARNLKSNLGCGREFVKPIVFTGGVAANAGVVKAIEEAFELEGELLVPAEHFFTGAIGAVLVAKKGRENQAMARLIFARLKNICCSTVPPGQGAAAGGVKSACRKGRERQSV